MTLLGKLASRGQFFSANVKGIYQRKRRLGVSGFLKGNFVAFLPQDEKHRQSIISGEWYMESSQVFVLLVLQPTYLVNRPSYRNENPL